MTDLANLQRAFQRAVLEHDPCALTPLIARETEERSTSRLAIYEHAYASRLRDALESNYPLLARWVGADAFAQFARKFIDAYPSRHFSIRNFGEAFPQWIASKFAAQPWIAEFAQWEWALGACFDGPNRDALATNALSDLSPGQWPSLRFELHPTIKFFIARTNAPQIYKAMAEQRKPPEAHATAFSRWIIWRRALTPCYRSMEVDEHEALQALSAGATFEMLCTIISDHQSENTAARAASLLREWLNAHLLCAIQIDR